MCSALIRHDHVHYLGHDSVHVVHFVLGGYESCDRSLNVVFISRDSEHTIKLTS